MKEVPLVEAYVPLAFALGEAFQFDWSDEVVELAGACVTVSVAQFRLCHSRMRYCRAYPRKELSMVIDAHIRAHNFFGGLCARGIYDNPKTVVTRIGRGKERDYNERFMQLASFYLFEPEACTPAAGWEKGQVENQVKTNRQNVFVPRLCFANFSELNAHLEEQMLIQARNNRHPEFVDLTVWEAFQKERPYLCVQARSFDGYSTAERRASSQCLVHYERNSYSVPCEYAGRHVTVRVYADRLVIAVDGVSVASHNRSFGSGEHILDPLHYLPLLSRKPGALHNGRPFQNWELPDSIRMAWNILRKHSDWDKQMSGILAAIPLHGMEAVGVACELAIEERAVNSNVILNHLHRLVEAPCAKEVPMISERLTLRIPPVANCSAYDRLRESVEVGAC